MRIKNTFKDLTGIFRVMKLRKKKIKAANKEEIIKDNVTLLAKELHPGKFKAVVDNIVQETSDSKRITLVSKHIPLFLAGQHLVMELQIGDSLVSRSYSIITSPLVAYKEKYVEIIVKDYKDGFVSSYLNHQLKVGDEVKIDMGLGKLFYQEFRDTNNIVAIAGGAGITPFISMAHDIVDRKLDINLTILYGSDNPKEIIAKDELESLMQDNIKVIHVISGKYQYKGEKGFIDKNIIKKYAPENATYFICGPKAMFRSVIKDLAELNVDLRRIRVESFSSTDITKHPDFDIDKANDVYEIEVRQGLHKERIKAFAKESIAVALERSGLVIKTACRAGKCGCCRVKVISGDFFVPKENDDRRYTDKEFNYVYSCSTYPMSDMIIKINIA